MVKLLILQTRRCFRKVGTAVLMLALSVLSSLAAVPPRETLPTNAPNIVLIVADDLGYGDLGSYGQQQIKTPNLDKLAAEGVRFTDFYAGSTVCAPSRCCLMTGLHTGHARIRGNTGLPLDAEDVTVAALLKEKRYSTGLIGKWGLGDWGTTGLPQKHGFDQFIGYLDQVHAIDYYTDHLARFDAVTGYEGTNVFAENQDGKRGLYIPDIFTKAALNFIRLHKPSPVSPQPFFLVLTYTIPHANNEEGARTGNGMQVPDSGPYRDEDWPAPEKNKASMITRMDADIGKLMQALKLARADTNTVVFFTSDNGPHKEGGVDPKFFHSSGPFRGFKRDLYEGGIRVPMLVRWPGHIPAGRSVSTPFAFWDFLPTACEIAARPIPKGTDGISFLPSLLGLTQTNRHEYLYWEFHERGFQQAIRMDEWKGVKTAADKPLEVYNLHSDPGESRDVAAAQPDVVRKLEAGLKTARTDSAQFPIRKGSGSEK